jgi:hypothetical protein
MRSVIALWEAFVHGIGTKGGSLLLLAFILWRLEPLLKAHDAKGWEATLYILGAITTLITGTSQRRQSSLAPPPAASKQAPAIEAPKQEVDLR